MTYVSTIVFVWESSASCRCRWAWSLIMYLLWVLAKPPEDLGDDDGEGTGPKHFMSPWVL